MKTQLKYIKWLSGDEMHQDAKEWLSELNFTLNEHFFMQKLIKDFTIQLVKHPKFADSVELTDAVNRSMQKNEVLIKEIQQHENKLEIMVDGINQPKEENKFREEHRILIDKMYNFLQNFKIIKAHLFNRIKGIKKDEKLAHLLSLDYKF